MTANDCNQSRPKMLQECGADEMLMGRFRADGSSSDRMTDMRVLCAARSTRQRDHWGRRLNYQTCTAT
jgi:hypothetical protein